MIMDRIFSAHYRELTENFDAAAQCGNTAAAAAWSCAMSEVAEVYAQINGITPEDARTQLREAPGKPRETPDDGFPF